MALACDGGCVHHVVCPGKQGAGDEEEDEEEAEFVECGEGHTLPQGMLQRINQRGWTAYLVAVVQPK